MDKQGTSAVIKLVDPRVFPSQLLQQRAERELKQLERLRHPGVVSVLDHGKRDSGMWIATERVDGIALDKLVAEKGPMAQDAALALVQAIGVALEEAAKHGVVHRDLSAKNVLVDGAHQPHLINFTVPVPHDERLQGVLEFVAPEQIEGRPVDQRCNIYSLGTICYFALTGKTPFGGEAQAIIDGHTKGAFTPPSQLANVTPAVEEVLLKALEKTSSKRYMTLRQFLGALGTAASGQQSAAPAGKPSASGVDTSKTLMGVPVSSSAEAPAGSPEVTQRDLNPAASAAAAHSAAQPQVQPAQPQVQPAQPQVQGAQPQGQPAQPQVQGAQPQVQPAQPQVQPAQPQVQPAAPVVGKGGGAGKSLQNKPLPATSSSKGKFRETMWFKKGELDEAAAEAAAKAKPDANVSIRSDSMEMDERYKDDGSLTSQDKDRLSLRTGATMMMEALPNQKSGPGVSEKELVSEMTAGRGKIVLAVVLGLIVIAGVTVLALTR
jgi:serine/threonine-protein kinase